MAEPRHLTTRRGFVAAASLTALSLYGVWAAFGAAPAPWGEDDAAEAAAAPPQPGHGAGHGAAGEGLSADQFRRLAETFLSEYGLPDGSVAPRPGEAMPAMAGHSAPAAAHAAEAGAPVDVYLLAQRWSFEPAVLQLSPGVSYRFRMMAVDVSHGAAIQLGAGSRIMRLRRNVLVEKVIAFRRPGEHLLYCTVFCGAGHDQMLGRILVS